MTTNTYNPQFHKGLLHPKYWATWFAIGIAVILAFVPYKLRDGLALGLAKIAVTIKSSPLTRAIINTYECFPHLSARERDRLLLETYTNAACSVLSFAVLLVRSKSYVEKRAKFIGEEHLTKQLSNKQNLILLVPHTWAIDIPGVILASRGIHVAAMMKKQRNPVIDWLMNEQRLKYGGRTHERNDGIKPFIKSIREGYVGYYLPDEDHGPKHSVFVPFMATEKATLTGLGKLARLSKATVLPVIPYYDRKTGQYIIEVQEPLEPFPSDSEEVDARMMNERIERFITKQPAQYMWILNILRSRADGSKRY
ncbi:lauroyl-Kdo(2)-lipid IV(A) myristoyltransferase [Photobacterium damselae]|uniref:lauroyl-Kdo(2)-lipid IV(A) myristoyltransferase n=1 Tax=Photobacterium damselae TaxID=38293 RepID=UPI00254316D5|nr:lauroyl-Kdo(2)-lipid IV(A) myristoyltransferase [Photobacterium damselae]ELI6447576.1 lauroyl-Kdo(2)-lipid IV(A) myristoyltransferase [Photobacterium damselae]WIH19561.1 lauroyl-Kdo(2)-lipid IV(A) myristoyltransferase [Photobacterium damselae]